MHGSHCHGYGSRRHIRSPAHLAIELHDAVGLERHEAAADVKVQLLTKALLQVRLALRVQLRLADSAAWV